MLELTPSLLPVILPTVFWAGYHYYKDRHLPEPIANIALCFLLGILSFYLGKSMYIGLGLIGLRYDAFLLAETNPAGLLAYAFFAIGPIEEVAKLLPFILFVLRFKAFDEPIDGIIYASFVALGFAAVENSYYSQFSTFTESIARGIAGPLVHIIFASIWGYHIGRAHIQQKPLTRVVCTFLMVAALSHGLYDAIVLLLPVPALSLSALLILTIWIWRMRLIRDLHQRALEG